MINIFYIISFQGQLFSFYHDAENIIQEKIFPVNNKKTPPKIIIGDAKQNFSIDIINNQIYLFAQKKSGELILCLYKNNSWQQKNILRLKFNYELKIYPLIQKTNSHQNFFLLYNIPSPEKNNFYLTLSKLQDNRWQVLNQIDKFYDTKNFFIQKLNSHHALIFYKTKSNSGEINLGYREINSELQTDFYNIYSSFQDISDLNFLTTDNSIHALFINQNFFTRQLIYKRKQDKFFSKPIILFQDPNINNPLLLIIKNNLYALWTINDKIYFCMSNNNGFIFDTPKIYSSNNFSITKAIYLSDQNQNQKSFFCRELYINKNYPAEIKFLPDLTDDFFQAKNFPHESQETNQIQINTLKNQLNLKNKQLEIKNKQILDLTNLLKNKNQEIISLLNKKNQT